MNYNVKFPVNCIRVAGYDIAIVIWTVHEATAAQRYGEFSSSEQTIRLQESFASKYKAVDTFLHEIMHAIFWVYGIGKDDDEERTVAMFGTALMTLHRDNQWLSNWIHEALS